MFFELWNEPPSIQIEPPSPIPPITPTTEQEQPLEDQAEGLPMQLEPPQPVTGQYDSDNVSVPTSEVKSEIIHPNRHDVENGLPTPPSEPIFETIDVDALSEDVEQPPPSTSNTTPEYEIIVDEDAGEADLTIGKASIALENSDKTNANADIAREVRKSFFLPCVVLTRYRPQRTSILPPSCQILPTISLIPAQTMRDLHLS